MKSNRGFALLGLVIALAVLAVVIAVFYLSPNNKNGKSTIENYVDDVQKAKDAKKIIENSQRSEQNSMD
jgi:Tfp pilus assembly protein PilE